MEKLTIDEGILAGKLLESLNGVLGNVFLSDEEFNQVMQAAEGTVAKFNKTAERHMLEIEEKAVGEYSPVWYKRTPVTVICHYFNCTLSRKLTNVVGWDVYKQSPAISWVHRAK